MNGAHRGPTTGPMAKGSKRGPRRGLWNDGAKWEDDPSWKMVATEGDDGGTPPTLPTPEPSGLGHAATEPIDLRFEFEELRVHLDLTDSVAPIRVDDGDRFEIIGLLGRGAMGAVYRARDHELDRHVALKVVGAIAAGREHVQGRLLQEARAMARLSHPNVVQVHDVRIALSGERVIALEYIDGSTLRTWQHGRGLDQILDVYLAAARGLAEAHKVGVVHRDFKPDNALVRETDDKPRVVVVDFGLAGGVVGDERVPEGLLSPIESTGLGTPEYMAPEQRERPADARCDQYALCVALWEAVDDRRPFGRDREAADEMPSAPARMPWWLYRVLRRGLAWQAEDRFADMHELVRAIERGRWRRKAAGWSAAGVVGIALLGGTAVALQPPPCADANAPLERVWNDVARAQVEGAFKRLNEPWADAAAEHALETLDAVTAIWSREATLVCEAKLSAKRSPESDRREACLAGWLDQVARSVVLLREGDRELAEDLVQVLDPLIAGGDLCRLPPPMLDPVVRTLLAEAEADEQVRRFQSALEKAERATEGAASARPCVEGSDRSYEGAAAYFRLGHVLGKLERWDEARAALGTAAGHALSCQDAWTAFDVRVFETFVYSHGEPAYSEHAQLRLDDANALLIPAAGPAGLSLRHAEWERMEGLLAAAGSEPNYDKAIAAFVSSRGLLEQLEPVPLARVLQVEHNIGSILQQAGRYDEAHLAFIRATRLLEGAVGVEHPQTVRMRALIDVNRGLLALDIGKLTEAEQLLSSAAEHGDPLVAVRAYSGWILSRLRDGEAKSSVATVRSFARWLEQHPELPEIPRAELLTMIGQGLTQASVLDGGGVDDIETFEAGLGLLRDALEVWDRLAREQAATVRYIIASSLFEALRHGEAEAVLDELLAENLETELRNAAVDLKQENERARERSGSADNSID